MSNMKDFLNFNQQCPICQKPLSLFMQWTGSQIDYVKKLFLVSQKENNAIMFEEHPISKKRANSAYGKKILSNITVALKEVSNKYVLNFNTLSGEKMARDQDGIYFFYLCNTESIEDLGHDHQVNVYHSCYYRSSPFVHLAKDNKIEKLSENFDIANRDEYFVIKNKVEDLEKIYIVILDNEEKKTTFQHYSVTDQQSLIENFAPNLFEKEMPLLNNRLNFEETNKEKLLNRLDSWVLMS